MKDELKEELIKDVMDSTNWKLYWELNNTYRELCETFISPCSLEEMKAIGLSMLTQLADLQQVQEVRTDRLTAFRTRDWDGRLIYRIKFEA
jgi:hypothetical protein